VRKIVLYFAIIALCRPSTVEAQMQMQGLTVGGPGSYLGGMNGAKRSGGSTPRGRRHVSPEEERQLQKERREAAKEKQDEQKRQAAVRAAHPPGCAITNGVASEDADALTNLYLQDAKSFEATLDRDWGPNGSKRCNIEAFLESFAFWEDPNIGKSVLTSGAAPMPAAKGYYTSTYVDSDGKTKGWKIALPAQPAPSTPAPDAH
jgi:hypothetical protein